MLELDLLPVGVEGGGQLDRSAALERSYCRAFDHVGLAHLSLMVVMDDVDRGYRGEFGGRGEGRDEDAPIGCDDDDEIANAYRRHMGDKLQTLSGQALYRSFEGFCRSFARNPGRP